MSAGEDEFKASPPDGSRYVDDVRSWQTSEPALDMTGSAISAPPLQLAQRSAVTPRSTAGRTQPAVPLFVRKVSYEPETR